MFHKTIAVRLAYGSMSLFIAILHNVFLLYYVDIFVSVYKIDRNSFWLGEVSSFILFRISSLFWRKRDVFYFKLWFCKRNDETRVSMA